MKWPVALLVTLLSIQYAGAQSANRDSLGGMRYLGNAQVKVGIDLNIGGAITYVADAKRQQNLINNSDWGRQIQMSFYSGPVPYEPNGHKAAPSWVFLGWNPIQSGDFSRNRSKIIDYKNDGHTMYVKCIPMHWPLNNVPGECYFESWIEVKDNTIQVHARLTNHRDDTTQYPARDQELPAIYTNSPYHRLITYRGPKPFNYDTVSFIDNHNPPGTTDIRWSHWQATENWAANLDKNDYGLGIFNGGSQKFQGGYFGDEAYNGNSKSSATAYIAPGNVEILDHDIVYDYYYTLILGTLNQIRGYVYNHSKNRALPSFRFTNNRQHWYYENTTDQGWPIKNELAVSINSKAALMSPYIFWKASAAPVLSITAAFKGSVTKARVYWRKFNNDAIDGNGLDFKVINDGKFHTYNISLNKSTDYIGYLNGLKIALDPYGTAGPGDIAELKAIALKSASAH